MKNLFLVLLVLIVFYSCENNSSTDYSGDLIFTSVDNPSLKTTISVNNNEKSTLDLGDIKGSREFFFKVSNGAVDSITDLSLTSDNDAFIISYSEINIIRVDVANISKNVTPVISISVIHGKKLDGIGSTELLPMGENSANISVSGKVYKDGIYTDIIADLKIVVRSMVMDIKLISESADINLTLPISKVLTNLGDINYYKVDNTVTLTNIGNTNLSLTEYLPTLGNFSVEGEPIVLEPNDKVSLDNPEGLAIYEIDSDGTVCDLRKFQVNNAGLGVFGLLKESGDPIETHDSLQVVN